MKHWIDDLKKINIDNFFDKDYVDMQINISDLKTKYVNTYFEVEDYIDLEDWEDMYLTHMSLAAALDSNVESIKGKKTRIELLKDIRKQKLKYTDNKINILMDISNIEFDVNTLKKMDILLSPKRYGVEQGVYRDVPKTFKSEKSRHKCIKVEEIENSVENLIEFIEGDYFVKYPIIKIGLVQLAFIKISPFKFDNVSISTVIVDKLIQKYYGMPIFFETPMLKFEENKNEFLKAVSEWMNTGSVERYIQLLKKIMIIELKSNNNLINLIKNRVVELFNEISKTNIKSEYHSMLIRFIIINNIFKIKDLEEKLPIKDRRTISKIAEELEKINLIYSISNTRIKRYAVTKKFINDFKLVYN